MKTKTLDCLDKMDEIGTCWEAVSDLMCVDNDAIQHRQRDNIGILLGHLQREYFAAREALSQAVREEIKE